MKKKFLAGLCAGAMLFCGVNSALATVGEPEKAKNVILMISDGQGFNTIKATDYYTGTQAVYEGNDFVKYGMQTNSANNPLGYNPDGMASSFTYAKTGATDSASAATAMYTGVKNYDGQINWSTTGSPLTTYFEMAAQAGKSIGAVSSVEFSHATPAAVYAHNASRNNYDAIANEGIYGSYNGNIKVLMGAGHGDYNDNGAWDPSKTDNYIGGTDTFNDMKDGSVNGFTFVDTKAGFEALTTGATPDKVVGVAQVNSTLQQSRINPVGNFDPINTNVPTLETMTKATLNVLDNDTDGFAVMIEGGAVDWANHANQLDRMIEEQIDFNNSVQAVVDYLDANNGLGTNGNNWSNTLLIITADHECGHLWGTGGYIDTNGNNQYDVGEGYAQVTDNGAGNLPGAQYFSGSHTNALVPMFAKGAGSELFAGTIDGTDPNLVAMYGLDGTWSGEYIDNTDIFRVMSAAAPVPVPGTTLLLMSGLIGIAGIRRRIQ